jgi:cell division transport system permease protein
VSALLRTPLYFVRRALDAMARGPRVTLVATGTIFVAVFVIGLFAAALHGAGKLLATWAGEVQISVYLYPSADLEAARAAAAAAAPGRAVEAVTAQEALRRFREALGSQGALLDGLRPEVLPPSVEVRAPGIRLDEARSLAKRLEAVPGVREVDYGTAWVERLERLLARLRWAGSALFLALAVGAAVLVGNTLRLGVFARRDEIEIMKLVGATDVFVELPFLIEGLLQGLVGGALATGALFAVAALALPRLAGELGLAVPIARGDLLPPALLAALVAGGGALGTIASALAVGRELKRS